MLKAAKRRHVRRIVLRLIGELRWWDGASLLIRAVGMDDEEVRSSAGEYLKRWSSDYYRLMAKPSHEQVAGLEEAIRMYGNLIDPGVLKDARYHLDYFLKKD